MAYRHVDRGGDGVDLLRGAAPLRHRRLDRPVEMGGRARRARAARYPQGPLFVACRASIFRGRRSSASTCSSGWPSSAPPTACAPASMSAWICSSIGCRRARASRSSCSACCAARSSPASSPPSAARSSRRCSRPASNRTISRRRCGSSISAIPLGSGLMCFRFLQVAWTYYWTGELPHHDEAHVEGIEADVPALHPATGDRRGGRRVARRARSALILILAPILILAVCLGEKAGIIVLPQVLRAAMIFALLIALMLTGIPVSIALGLTVLTFLFTLTEVPIEAVSMKLFTGIESFEIMAIPFFILAGNFLTHGGVARRMIDFATSMVGHWHGGLGLAGIVACAMFAAGVRFERRHRRRHRRDRAARDGAERLSHALWRRHHHGRRLARHPDAAVDPEDHLRDLHQHVDRRVVRRRLAARHAADRHALRGDLVPGPKARLSANAEGDLGRALARIPGKHLGPDAHRHHYRRHLLRPVHRDRSCRDGRGLLVLHFGVRLQGSQVEGRAAGAAVGREHQRDAALHRHQRGAVLICAQQREYPLGAGGLDHGAGPGLGRLPPGGQRVAADWPAISWSRLRSS